MARALTVLAFIVVALSSPIYLLFAGFAPALTGGFSKATPLLKQALGHGLVLAIWLVPVWVGVFGWRAIKAWKHGGSTLSALLMMLPALAMLGFFLYVNFTGFGP